MQLGHLRYPDRPSAATRRLASRPQSGVWTDDLAHHRKAPPPPSGPSATKTRPTPKNTPKKLRFEDDPVEASQQAVTDKSRADSPTPPPQSAQTAQAAQAAQTAQAVQGQRRLSGARRPRPSYPPQSPSQRARSLSVELTPPKVARTQAAAQSPSTPAAQSTQAAQAAQPPRPPSPRPKSTSPTPTPTFMSILDRPHPNSRPRSVSPPSSVLVTPTESVFQLPAPRPITPLAFPVPRPTPPASPATVPPKQQAKQEQQQHEQEQQEEDGPETPRKAKPSPDSRESERTPTQKQRQRPTTLHAIQYQDLANALNEVHPPLKQAVGKRPTYNAAAQFSALVLVKSNTPSIYECAAGSASCSSLGSHTSPHGTLSARPRHMRTQSHQPISSVRYNENEARRAPRRGMEELPDVPSISVTAPTPSSPRFSFSSIFPPKKSPMSPKRAPRQRKVSAEASQWAWGAKRGSRQSSQSTPVAARES